MKLYPWQEHELLDKKPKKMIRADPRLGKTLVGATWALETTGSEVCIIVAPLSVCPSWADTIDSLGSRMPEKAHEVFRMYSAQGKSINAALRRFKAHQRVFIVTNYDKISTYLPDFLKLKPACLILDESHLIKSPSSQRGKSLRALGRVTPNVRLLTGTPAPNGPQDLWGQMTVIDPVKWEKSFTRFSQKHLIVDSMQYNKVLGARDPDNLQNMFESDASIYRREDVFGPDTWQEIHRNLDLPKTAQDLYRQAVRSWVMESKDSRIDLDVNHTLSRMMRLQQLTAGFLPNEDGIDTEVHRAKVDAVLEDLEDIVEAGEKVVIFHRYRWEGDKYEQELREKFGPIVYRLYGDTLAERRAQDISQFNDVPGAALYIVQTSAGGIGISLAGATHAFFVSQYFSFDVERQARDRIYSPGKNRCITYYRFLNTIDMYIASLLSYKRNFHEALSNSTAEGIAFGTPPHYRDR